MHTVCIVCYVSAAAHAVLHSATTCCSDVGELDIQLMLRDGAPLLFKLQWIEHSDVQVSALSIGLLSSHSCSWL
jgi:hypothetical protein